MYGRNEALTLEKKYESYTLGKDITLSQVKTIDTIATRHGFRLGGFRSFERAVTEQEIAYVKACNQPNSYVNKKFNLTSQARRSSVSVTSNIAEGFSRGTAKDKNQFYTVARGSLTELRSQILVARDLGYMNIDQYQEFDAQIEVVGKLLSGLLKSAMNK